MLVGVKIARVNVPFRTLFFLVTYKKKGIQRWVEDQNGRDRRGPNGAPDVNNFGKSSCFWHRGEDTARHVSIRREELDTLLTQRSIRIDSISFVMEQRQLYIESCLRSKGAYVRLVVGQSDIRRKLVE